MSETKHWLGLVLSAAVACGGAGTPQRDGARAIEPPPAPESQDTFASWLARMQDADAVPTDAAVDSANCLFVGDRGGWEWVGAWAPVLQPIPDPESTPSPVAASNIVLLTRHGNVVSPARNGDASPVAAFAVLTPHETFPDRIAFAYVTESGIRKWCVGDGCPSERAGSSGEATPSILDEARLVVLSAAGSTPLRRLAEVMAQLADGQEVAVAAALPARTRLPATEDEAPRESGSDDTLCPVRGFPAAESEGAYRSTAALRAALEQIRPDWEACMQYGAAEALELRFRVGASGEIRLACIQEPAGDPRLRVLRQCILAGLRRGGFPPPEQPGAVDVALPLRLTQATTAKMRGVCPARD